MIIQRHNPAYRPAYFFINTYLVFFIYWALPNKYRPTMILVASYYFYMSWNVKYVVLILFTTVVSYSCSLLMEKWKNKKAVLLWSALVASLGVLFLFQYFNFAIPMQPITLSLMLPVGISFYTFQTLSYGLLLMAWGFFKKLVVADNLAVYADHLNEKGVGAYCGYIMEKYPGL